MESFKIEPLLIIISQLILGIIILFAILNARKRKINQRVLINQLDIKKNYFPIRYSTYRRFVKFWKYYPWEYSGIIYVNEKNDLIFYYISDSEKINEKKFVLNDCHVKWVGQDSRNGFSSWFSIQKDNDSYFFTSETGAFIFKGNLATKDIYRKLKKSNFS